jgi:Uma2 family endonuclease
MLLASRAPRQRSMRAQSQEIVLYSAAMVSRTAEKTPAELWAELEALPEHLKGEIIDGQLYVQARPRPRHARGIGFLGRFLGGSFDYDADGPGGWWIVPEPGIELPRAPEVSPDLAGWRREALPQLPPEDQPFRTVPDWVCEVLSPSNARYDQQTKAPFYASVGVPWLWLVDTRSRLIEVRRLAAGLATGKWLVEGVFSEEPAARIPPFEAIEIPLHRLWID